MKIWIKIFKGFKFFWKFKKNINNNLKKLNENYNFYYYLFLLLTYAWVVSHPLQNFRGFGGSFPPFPLVTPLIDTTKSIAFIFEKLMPFSTDWPRHLVNWNSNLICFNYRQDIFEIHVITMAKSDININILIRAGARFGGALRQKHFQNYSIWKKLLQILFKCK